MGVTLERQRRRQRLRRCIRSRRGFVKRIRMGRSSNAIQRRVSTLKELVPKTKSMDLDGLFRETADYILALQMKVRVMQTMVQVLTQTNHI